jgi:hypothetical protein
MNAKYPRRPGRPVLLDERYDLEIPIDLELIRIGLEESILMAELRLLDQRPSGTGGRETSLRDLPGRAPGAEGATGKEARPKTLPDVPPADRLPRD